MTNSAPEGAPRIMLERPPILLVAGFSLPDQSSHFFNELLGYRTAAEALGWTPKVFVPRTADPCLAAQLSAHAVLTARPVLPGFGRGDVGPCLDAFFDATDSMSGLWGPIEAEDLTAADAILFPEEHPILICAAGHWLAGRPAERRPAVFFRFVGNPLDSSTGQPTPHTPYYRLASRDLRTRAGQERVFFLVNNAVMARTVTRVCSRRTFLTPMPKFMPPPPPPPPPPRQPTVYIHLNERSGRLLTELGTVIRRVLESDPAVRFLVKFTLSCADRAAPLEPDIAAAVEILPPEQDPAAYLGNFSRCTLALLAYESAPYAVITSGVFAEAAAFGKPIVVPAGTTMALDIAEGRAAGCVFASAEPEQVAAALIEALRSAPRLETAAREIALRAPMLNSCLRVVERMIALARSEPDMEPRYRLGEQIDFSNYVDSRCFMRGGWGETEAWGVWTIRPRAELELWLEQEPHSEPLRLNVIARPFLTPAHPRNRVGISAEGQPVAEWIFDLDDTHGIHARQCEAVIPARRSKERGPLRIAFSIETPIPPIALGLSADTRNLGLGLSRLWLSAHEVIEMSRD